MILFTGNLDLVREVVNIINEEGYTALSLFAMPINQESWNVNEPSHAGNYRGTLNFNGKKVPSAFKCVSQCGELAEGKEYNFILMLTRFSVTWEQFISAYSVLYNFLKERANGRQYILQESVKEGDSLQGHSGLGEQES